MKAKIMTSDTSKKKMSFFPRSWGGSPQGHKGSLDSDMPSGEEASLPPDDSICDPADTYPETPVSGAPPPAPFQEVEETADMDVNAEDDQSEGQGPAGPAEDFPLAADDEGGDPEEPFLDEGPGEWLDTPCRRRSCGMAQRSAAVSTESQTAPRIKVNVVGIRFAYACRVYHFDAGDLELQCNDWVIVKTEKGLGLGQVAAPPFERELTSLQLEGLRKVMRKAGKADLEQKTRCAQKEAEAFAYCLENIDLLGLPMKLVATECFFDGSKYVFYFTAEGRVDFRELVKLLVARFPVRIEMRQIGVRHEAKMTGGLGSCGQELCCARFLTDFKPVSVKMAKTQNLSLNPTKISGVCGRLMCCLAYEYDIYEEFKKGLPKVGKPVKTSKGDGVVVKHDPLTETLQIRIDEETTIEVTKDELLPDLDQPVQKKGRKSSQ